MLERKDAVVWLGAWLDACCLWRLYMPHLSMPGSKFFIFAQRPDFNVIAGNDICVVQRCCTQGQFNFIQTAAQLDMRIVYDLDDNVWELPTYNPAHGPLTQAREGFKACIRMVDVVSVSTKTLAMAVRKHVKFMTNIRTGKEIPIIVAENRMEERMFIPPVRREGLVVGWAGSSSHVGDLSIVEEALLKCSEEIPEMEVEFRGCELAGDSPLLQLKNFTHKLWTPVPEFGARMPLWGWTIALAPVTEHVFNDSKSCIKMLEAAYSKIPCLASWVRPYDEMCSHDKELKWLLCPGPSAWYTKLRALLNDEAMRKHYGERLYAVAKQYYSFDKPHEGWGEVFKTARAM